MKYPLCLVLIIAFKKLHRQEQAIPCHISHLYRNIFTLLYCERRGLKETRVKHLYILLNGTCFRLFLHLILILDCETGKLCKEIAKRKEYDCRSYVKA